MHQGGFQSSSQKRGGLEQILREDEIESRPTAVATRSYAAMSGELEPGTGGARRGPRPPTGMTAGGDAAPEKWGRL